MISINYKITNNEILATLIIVIVYLGVYLFFSLFTKIIFMDFVLLIYGFIITIIRFLKWKK